jgi:transcriptional regulator with XRE-family HTH domain
MIQGLSKKLTLLRQQHKLSQSEVARRLNISSSAVSAFEAEQISPSLETLVKLANLYHVSTDYLLGVDYPRDKAVLDTSGLNKQQLTVLQNLIDVMKQ